MLTFLLVLFSLFLQILQDSNLIKNVSITSIIGLCVMAVFAVIFDGVLLNLLSKKCKK